MARPARQGARDDAEGQGCGHLRGRRRRWRRCRARIRSRRCKALSEWTKPSQGGSGRGGCHRPRGSRRGGAGRCARRAGGGRLCRRRRGEGRGHRHLVQRHRDLQRVAAEGSASGAPGRAVCASHHNLYAGALPHGAGRGAPYGRTAIRRNLDNHRHAVSHGNSRTSAAWRRRLQRSSP